MIHGIMPLFLLLPLRPPIPHGPHAYFGMRRAGNAVERNVTKRTAAVIDDPTKVVLRFPLGQSPNAISGSPVVPESETGEANIAQTARTHIQPTLHGNKF